ncbi:MAG: response regulator [Anaerolineae bacterium]
MTTILLIEDEVALLDEIAANLGYAGFEIYKASSGEAGIALAHEYLPDLIVCDLMMPAMDGYGVLFEIRSHPMTMKIPFVFLTARTDRDSYREAMQRGADDYLTKPFTHNELLLAINARLDKKVAEDEEFRQQLLNIGDFADPEKRIFKAENIVSVVNELRYPVMAVLWANSLMRNYADSISKERRSAVINRVEASARQLLQAFDDLLLITQASSGELPLNPAVVNMEQFCREIIEEVQRLYADNYRITFRAHFDTEINADKKYLHHLINNLLTYALRHTRDGGEVVMLLHRQQDELVIKVRDQGVGVSEQEQQQWREALEDNASADSVDDLDKLGLSLAVIKYIVNAHRGTFRFETEAGNGTVFTVTLPVNRSHSNAAGNGGATTSPE